MPSRRHGPTEVSYDFGGFLHYEIIMPQTALHLGGGSILLLHPVMCHGGYSS